MDRVILSGVRCALRVGVTPSERRNHQDCRVDVEIEADLSRPMQTDDVRDTLDYARVLETVHEVASEGEFALLERYAGRLEKALRARMEFVSVTIRVQKLQPPLPGQLDAAGIEVRR